MKDKKGFSLIEVMIAAAIIAIVCAIAMPNFNRMRANSYRDQCVTHLRMIMFAKEQWSLETGASDTDTATSAQLDPYIKNGSSTLVCPIDTTSTFDTSYNINDISNKPSCKIDGTHILP